MDVIIKIQIDETVKKSAEESKETKSYSQYAKFFDESCPDWTRNSEYNLMFLSLTEQKATAKLVSQGYLFLNDVYDMLGISRTKAGAVVGWIYDKENPDHVGDNYVDFGIYDAKSRRFVNGYETTILLDFNVDGLIFDKIYN